MRMSQLLLQTLREAPSDARTPGYQFLVRSGFVRPVVGGFAFLPLGVSVRQRIEEATCQLLRSCGGQTISLPIVRPTEVTDPRQGAEMGGLEEHPIRFRDREQRELLLGAGHEVAILAMAVGVIRSYRQLPVLLYEAWQRFRDEVRSVGGLLGGRECRVVDAYGLYRDQAELAEGYDKVRKAFSEMFASWDLGTIVVIRAEDEASRPVGHSIILPVADGEQTYAHCPACGYAADQTVARVWQPPSPPAAMKRVSGGRPAPAGSECNTRPAGQSPLASEDLQPMQDVETPNCKTIADLASFLGIPASRTAKVVFLVASYAGKEDRFVFAVVRGDTALNEDKLRAALEAQMVGPATEAEIRQAGAEPGYGSPVGLPGATVVVDTLAARSPNLVAGANKPGYHTLNVNLGRDYQASIVADIATAQEGSPCPCCGSRLVIEQGVTLAETRQLGDRLSRTLNATYLDSSGSALPVALGRYRVYIDRTLAALAERHHDQNGFVWPATVAPYRVYLMTVGKSSPEVNAAAERLYADLTGAAVGVLFDDRDERAGVKFNDADLIGAPWRVAVGDRGLQSGTVEVKARHQTEVRSVALDELVAFFARETLT